MKIPNEVVENLIEKDNPFPTIFQYMTQEIWQPQEDLATYFQQDKKAKEFEKFLQDTYFELFTEEIPKHASGGLDVDLENEKLVLLDMLSIREAVLLKEHLQDNGWKVELDYSFSALPSKTEDFKQKIDLPKKKKEYKFRKINDSQNFSLDGDEEFIWSSFPDSWLEDIQKGKKVKADEKEVYKNTEEHLDEILEQLEGDEIVVTSDHGYNVAKPAFQFNLASKDQQKIKEVMGNNRAVKDEDLDADKLVEAGFLVKYDGWLMAQSRNIWPIRGSYSVYQHGGVSLLECMTPKLKIRRGEN
ncbi:MAG: hypothetical protein ABEJ95_06400 [Candidatus Nanohalobium sp.]